MSWIVFGSSADISMRITESGAFEICGEGINSIRAMPPFPDNLMLEVLEKVNNVPSLWSIVSSSAEEIDIDGTGLGLCRRVQEEPRRVHGMAIYSGSEAGVANPAILLKVVLPPRHHLEARRLFQLITNNPHLDWSISVDFLGFRVPEAQTDTPTAQEFTAGRPYFFEEVSISAGRRLLDRLTKKRSVAMASV
jgi:hypothetical protein